MLQLVARKRLGDRIATDRARNDTSLLLLLQGFVLFVRSCSIPRKNDLVGIGEGEGGIGCRANAEAYSLACQPYWSGLQ